MTILSVGALVRVRRLLLIGGVAFAAAPGSLPAAAQVETSFTGKQITITIGYGTGGTYYAYARLIADHFGKHIPGQPTIIVQSMPGAGGLVMVNTAAIRMSGDGTQLFMPPDTMVIAQLAAQSPVPFDVKKFHYLGAINQQNNFFVVRTAKAKSIADLKAHEVIVGHSGNGSAGHLVTAVAREVLGARIKAIAGYKGSRDTLLALERKEIDASTFGWETYARTVPHWFKGQPPFAVTLFQTGYRPDPQMSDVPLLRRMVEKEHLGLVELIDTQVLIGRSLAMPPSAKPQLVGQFRKSMQAMFGDAQFKEEAKRRDLILTPVSGEQLQASIERTVTSTSPSVIARAKEIMK